MAGWSAVVTAAYPIVASSWPTVEDMDDDGAPEVRFAVELYDHPRVHGSVVLFDAQAAPVRGAWSVFVADHSFRYTAGPGPRPPHAAQRARA